MIDKDKQTLHDVIFGDTWEKFVSHEDFPKFYHLCWIKEHHESTEYLEEQLQKVANKILTEIKENK